MTSTAGDSRWAVEFRGLAKTFGTCVAARDVSLKIERGSVHALLGENGAGKSTAMKMLYGLIKPDQGEMLVDGRAVHWRSPKDAIAAGIGMVHQHFMLAETETGLDNIILGAEDSRRLAGSPGNGENALLRWLPAPLRPIRRDAAAAALQKLATEHQWNIDLTTPVASLPVGVQQRLEILKLLYRDVNLLILDEPTAVLTPQETDELFKNLNELKAQGKTIIIITHKLGEVMRFADRATVLRRGATVGTVETRDTSEAQLAEMMVGRAVELTVKVPPKPERGAVQLRLEGVRVASRDRRNAKALLDDLSLSVHGGEVVGVAGVEGNGQSDLLDLLLDPRGHFVGRQPLATGQLEILGKDARRLVPEAVRDLGVGHVPEDRHRQGLILSFDLAENFLLGHARSPGFSAGGIVRRGELRRRIAKAIERFDIRPADWQSRAADLSGGNQQKVVIAREMELAPMLLIAAQPTRGVDVGSIEFIHQQILEARARGCAVLLVSSSLEEIRALSDRIVVLYEGRINATFERGEADEATLGRHMGGGGSVG